MRRARLLLSATLYRMLTLSGDEPDDGEHYRDFLETLSFLYGRTNGPQIAATLEGEMRQFRGFLHALPEARPAAIAARRGVERRLRKVMARTERVASTVNRDSMVGEPPTCARRRSRGRAVQPRPRDRLAGQRQGVPRRSGLTEIGADLLQSGRTHLLWRLGRRQ
ncbi:hypothetical protein [Mesorhizobium sp. ES1-3]|uniref:hypothetical protein n=1 Tax=Mesorhizobium sp. ES1-3 TaxID=2876628 RepID=UPI001CCE4F2B|nr:hypothetical protein [Mesorhizobium sp. ES1-3]MBZ9674039.1 hypothetical protein [Mesorhizobium sp. ES1-3]